MKKLTLTCDEKNRLHRSQDDGDTFPLHVFLYVKKVKQYQNVLVKITFIQHYLQ